MVVLFWILRLSNSPSLHHCRRTFTTALNHTRVVFPATITHDKGKSVTDDLIWSVTSLRQDVESLRKEFRLLSEVVSSMQKCIAQGTMTSQNKGNGQFGEEIWYTDNEGYNEKATEKMSDFSQAMATHFNTKIVISHDEKADENISDFSEEVRTSETRDNNEKVAAEKMDDFSEEIQESDTEGITENSTEKMSDFSQVMATDDIEIEKSDTEGNNETVPDGKEQDQDPLLKEIESEILHAEDFSRVSSQGVNFPDDFPFKLEEDALGVPSITLKRRYKLENIVVTVSTPSVFTSITAKNYQYYKTSNFIMKLTVEIFPAISEGRDIAFDCSAFSTGLLIENVYGGYYSNKLVFSELNDNLQTEFKKYLEMRGITPSTINSIFGYMLDKVNREKLRSLYKFKELVEA